MRIIHAAEEVRKIERERLEAAKRLKKQQELNFLGELRADFPELKVCPFTSSS